MIDWLSSSRLFFSQRFSRLILLTSSGLSRTREFRTQPFIVPGVPCSYSIKAIAASIDAVTATALGIELSTFGDFQFLIQRLSRLGHVSLGRRCINFWDY